MLRDSRNRRALDSVLPQHFRCGLQQLSQRFAAAGLLRSQRVFSHGPPLYQVPKIMLDTIQYVNVNSYLRYDSRGPARASRPASPLRRTGGIPMASASAPASVSAPALEHPLANPNYRLWLIGGTISFFGDQFYLVALPWLVLQQTNSAAAMGAILMAGAVPRAFLMLMGGAVSDRISAR